MQYGYLVFRNGATRTYEHSFDPCCLVDLSSSDYTVSWEIVDNDFFSYNYLGDGASSISYSVFTDAPSSETPQPGQIAWLIATTPRFPLQLILASCLLSIYQDPSWLVVRQTCWSQIKNNNESYRWLDPHWIANIETWCNWWMVPVT